MRRTQQLWRLFVTVLLITNGNASVLFADRDAHALSYLFGEEHLGANIDIVRQYAASLGSQERYEFLADWVLPSESHSAIRLTASFAPYVANPNSSYTDSPGTIVSPALDLISTAESVGRLDDLYQRVSQIEVEGEHQERCLLAFSGMVQIRRGEIVDAEKILNDLEARRIKQMAPNLYGRWPETLLLGSAAENPVLREVAAAYLLRILHEQVRVAENSIGHDEWDRYIQGLCERIRVTDLDDASANLMNWQSVTECDEKTRAVGFPQALWLHKNRQVQSLVRHQNNYLFYRIPLRGQYEVECDITGFGYREGQLVIGGHWISPHYHHKSFEFGNLRGVIKNPVPVDPKLSQVDDWIRYRAVVRDGLCRIFLNGRELVSEPILDHQFPWIGLRTMFFTSAQVRDVRITGSPEVPKTIEMTSDPNLSGWVRYHRDTVGGPEGDWRFDENLGPQGGLFARRKDEMAGTFHESLLRYFRPMLEDGVIEYEFYYEPGKAHVSPALDSQAFLLNPDGVEIHWITNGVWDRTGLDPMNKTPTNQANVPLHSGWNQLRFEVDSDVVNISVNQTNVYSGDVPKNNDRTFGLFHYADQSEVQVRNMIWQGDWPAAVPELAKQELRGTQLDELETRSAELPVEFDFDFSKPSDDTSVTESLQFQNRTFFLQNVEQEGMVTQTAEGLIMERSPSKSFKDIWIAPDVRVAGDFDVVAEFEDFRFEEPKNGDAALYLTLVTRDELTTHTRVWHGVYAHPDSDCRRVTQAEFNYFRPGRGVDIQFEGTTAEESSAGRMRITRIGKTYSFMIAEGNSLNYRLIHQQDVNDEDTNFNGIRIGMGTRYANPPKLRPQVLWKKLQIRAEALAEN